VVLPAAAGDDDAELLEGEWQLGVAAARNDDFQEPDELRAPTHCFARERLGFAVANRLRRAT
jgi:hypothetical protein